MRGEQIDLPKTTAGSVKFCVLCLCEVGFDEGQVAGDVQVLFRGKNALEWIGTFLPYAQRALPTKSKAGSYIQNSSSAACPA